MGIEPSPDDPSSTIPAWMEGRFGLRFTAELRSRWDRFSSTRADELGLNQDEYAAKLRRGQPAFGELAAALAALVNRETHFMRGAGENEALQYGVVPRLIERARRNDRAIRILSAGCSTGEEAYSLAIALLDARGPVRSPPIEVLGVDIDATSLHRARQAHYGAWSMRSVPTSLRRRHFSEANGRITLRPRVRELVTFEYANLLDDRLPRDSFDLVVCRNVLVHLRRSAHAIVVRNLGAALAEGGTLQLGASDQLGVALPGCVHRHVGSVVVYERVAPALPPVEVTPATATESAVADQAAEHLRAGLRALDRGSLDDALAALRRALYLDDESLLAHAAMALVAARRGDRDLSRRQGARLRFLLRDRPAGRPIEGWEGMTTATLLRLFSDPSGALVLPDLERRP